MWLRGVNRIGDWTRRAFLTGGVFSASFLISGNDEQLHTPQRFRTEYPAEKKDGLLISRKITSEADNTGLGLRLYQYQTCPFCCKVRAFLDYYGFSYEVVEVNPVTRSQLKFLPNYKKVPVVVTKGNHILTESSLIISMLSTFLQCKDRSLDEIMQFFPSVLSTDPKTQKQVVEHPNKFYVMLGDKNLSDSETQSLREEREWREWVDNHFVHLISPNVYRTWKESLATFRWFSEAGDWERTFPAWERYLAVYIGALAMYGISKKLKKKHGIGDERAALIDACDEWIAALGDRKFLGGDRPSLADLALFGSMNSFVGCEAFREMRSRSKIGDWFDRMREAVESHAGHEMIEARCR